MLDKYSDLFGVSHGDLMNEGAFNAYIKIDSQLYVDPFLLRTTTAPEMDNAYKRFTEYFENVIRILRSSSSPNDRMFREAHRLLIFKELKNVSLGYSKTGSPGSGIGHELAKNLTFTAKEIINAGIEDPTIFEIVGLIENRIGADRISDMTIRIILPELMLFSQRVAKNLEIKSQKLHFQSISYDLPINPVNNAPIILIPNEILRDLPVAKDWSDIERISAHNEQLRRMVNQIIGRTWKEAIRNLSKNTLKEVLLDYPELIFDLLSKYSQKHRTSYNFKTDPEGIFSWEKIAENFSREYPLELNLHNNPSPEQLLELVVTICNHFKVLVERNGLNKLFYKDRNHLHHENYAQLLLFAIADSYCISNNIDITREANGGRGPVDFKFSHGFESKVTVEVKYSSNPQLIHGYETQLPIYNMAERSHYSVYLIIITKSNDKKLQELRSLRNEKINNGFRAPEIIFIDGKYHQSASRA